MSQTTRNPSIETIRSNPVYYPFQTTVIDTATEKQLHILMAARNAALNDDTNQHDIATVANSSDNYVTTALMKYAHRKDLPTAYAVARNCIANKSRRDLTDAQQAIIGLTIADPDRSQTSIANEVGVTQSYVSTTQRRYKDILEAYGDMGIDSIPAISDDFPLTDLDTQHTPNSPSPPESLDTRLFRPFPHDYLTELSYKKRFILLAAREWAIRGDTTLTRVADTVDMAYKTVKVHLFPFSIDDAAPAPARAVGTAFFSDTTYADITGTKLSIIDHVTLNPDTTLQQISNKFDVSKTHVSHIVSMYEPIIESRRQHIDGTS